MKRFDDIVALRSGIGRGVLLVAVIAIWATVSIRLFVEFKGSADVVVAPLPSAGSEAPPPLAPRRPFVGDFADPFARENASERTSVEDDWMFGTGEFDWQPPRHHAPPPALRLRGVIGGTAIIETQQSGIVLAKEGTTVEGSTIEIVERDHIVVESNGEYHTLLLVTEDLAETV